MIMTQEAALLKAKERFQMIEEAIRQATLQGKRIDVVEENLWDNMLSLGRLMLTSFVAGQGTGDLGPTLEHEGRTLNRLGQLHNKPYVSVFGPLPAIERVFSVGLYDVMLRRCYAVGRQQNLFRTRTTYEAPIEITFANQTDPRTQMLRKVAWQTKAPHSIARPFVGLGDRTGARVWTQSHREPTEARLLRA